MDERSKANSRRFIAFLLVTAVAAGLWLFLRRPATTEAIEGAIEPFVPTAPLLDVRLDAVERDPLVPTARRLDARLDAIERARQVTDAINARSQRAAAPRR